MLNASELPVGRVWERVDQNLTVRANNSHLNGQRLYAVGDRGVIWKTTDRRNWVMEETYVDHDLFSIVCAGEIGVAVGENGCLLRKAGQGPWIEIESGSSTALRSVAYGGGWFLAVGDDGQSLRSEDGLVWLPFPTGTNLDLRKVIWSGERFVSATTNLNTSTGAILSSLPGAASWDSFPFPTSPFGVVVDTIIAGPDRISIEGRWHSENALDWTESSPGASTEYHSGVFGDGKFVTSSWPSGVASLAPRTMVYHSTSGDSWESVDIQYKNEFVSMHWNGSLFLGVTPSREVLTSLNGIEWTREGIGPQLTDLHWNGELFLATPARSGALLTSTNGGLWTNRLANVRGRMATGGGKTVAVSGRQISFTEDGFDWGATIITLMGSLKNVEWTGTEFLAVGNHGSIFASPDGEDWQLQNPGRIDSVTWDGTRYLATAQGTILTSDDGNHWTALGMMGNFPDPPKMNALSWNGTRYCAVGNSGQTHSSYDGITWFTGVDRTNDNSSPNFRALAYGAGHFVAVGFNKIWRAREVTGARLFWFNVPKPENTSLQDLIWDGSQFVMVGDSTLFTSVDGYTWGEVSDWPDHRLKSIAWNGAEYILCGERSLASDPGSPPAVVAFSATSTDLTSWNTLDGPPNDCFEKISSDGSTHLVRAQSGRLFHFSGQSWQEESPQIEGAVRALLFAQNQFQAFSETGMVSRRSSAGIWSPGARRSNTADLTSIASNGTLTVVAGNGPMISASSDGKNWDSEPLGGSVSDVVWTGREFKAVTNTTLYTSPDGQNWQAKELPPQFRGQSLTVYRDRLFIAGLGNILEEVDDALPLRFISESPTHLIAGTPNRIFSSTRESTDVSFDGLFWEQISRAPRTNNTLHEIISTPHGFVAVGEQIILHSPDGMTWRTVTEAPGEVFHGVTYGNGQIIAVGTTVSISGNGTSWTRPRGLSIDRPFEFLDIVWNGSFFAAVGKGDSAASANGFDWTQSDTPSGPDFLCWDGTRFVGASRSGIIQESPDGLTWSKISFGNNLQSLGLINDTAVITLGAGGGARSSDGQTWQGILPPENRSIQGQLELINDRLFSIDQVSTNVTPNGFEWAAFGSFPFQKIVWANDRYYAFAPQITNVYATTTDGTNLDTINPTNGPIGLRDVVWTGTSLIAVGENGSIKSTTDGTNWSDIPSGTTSHLIDILWDGSETWILDETGKLILPSGERQFPEEFIGRKLFFIDDQLIATGNDGLLALLGAGGWTSIDTNTGVNLNSIGQLGNRLLLAGEYGTISISASLSPTGPWSLISQISGQTSALSKISFADGTYEIIQDDGALLISSDARVWSGSTRPGFSEFNDQIFLGEERMTVGGLGQIKRIRPDGSVIEEENQSDLELHSIAGSSAALVAVGDDGIILLSKSGAELFDPYHQWIFEQGASGADYLPYEDLDRDGVDNLMEFLHGFSSDPANPQNAAGLLPSMNKTANDWSVTFEINDSEPSIMLQVEETTNFEVWNVITEKRGASFWQSGAPLLISEAPSGRRRITLRLPETTLEPKFYRLRAARR